MVTTFAININTHRCFAGHCKSPSASTLRLVPKALGTEFRLKIYVPALNLTDVLVLLYCLVRETLQSDKRVMKGELVGRVESRGSLAF